MRPRESTPLVPDGSGKIGGGSPGAGSSQQEPIGSPGFPPDSPIAPGSNTGDAGQVPGQGAPASRTRGSTGVPPSGPRLSGQQLGGANADPGGLNSAVLGEKSLLESPSFGSLIDTPSLRESIATDLAEAIQWQPGVLVQSTARGQASPFLRGVTGQQTLVLVDGIRLNNQVFRAGPNQYFNTVDPGQVERIEVVRGGGSVLWGDGAIGGVINIVTRGASLDRGNYHGSSFRTVFSTADNAWYGRGNVEGWAGRSGLFAGASYMDVHNLDIGGGHGRQPFTDYDQYAGDIKYNFLLNDDQLLTVALSHFEQQNLPRSDRFAPFVFNRPGNTPRPTFFDPQQRDLSYIRWQGNAYNPNPFFDTFSTTVSLLHVKEGSSELRAPNQLDVGQFTDDTLGYTLHLQKDLDTLGVVTYGAQYSHDDIDSTRSRFNPTRPNAAPTTRPPQYPDDAYSDRIGALISWDVLLTERLNVVFGTRYENVDIHATPRFTVGNTTRDTPFDRTYQEWIGSVGLNYELADDWSLVGGVYEGFRSPTLDDLTANVTFQQNSQQNPVAASLAVQPEHSYTYEIGSKLDVGPWQFQAFEWWMTIDDFIARNVDSVGNLMLGNHEAYLNGTELMGEYRWTDRWSIHGNLAYTYGKDLTDNQPYSRIPPLQGILGLRWRDRGAYVDLFTWLADRQDRYNAVNLTDSRFFVGGVAATPGFGTLNLRAGRNLGRHHRVNLALENITDKFYRVLGSGVDGAGFNAVFGYEYSR